MVDIGETGTQARWQIRLSPEVVMVLSGWSLMLLAYISVFAIIGGDSIASATRRSVINTVPAALLSWPLFILLERRVIEARPIWQWIFHVGLALGFSLLWYIGIQVGYGLQSGWTSGGIVGQPLLGAALAWQLFQGVTLYAAVAGFAYAMTFRKRWRALRDGPKVEPLGASPKRIFVRDGKSILPVDLDDIYCFSGAGDYSDIITRNGTITSGTALSAFEEDLPSQLFLRVHRSHIVRMDAILSVESAGNGRLTLHLPKGLSVTTSRAGASSFRNRAL